MNILATVDENALLKIDKIIDHLTTTVFNKDVAAIKSMKRVENVMKVWHRDTDTTIDGVCTGCCKVVDIAARLRLTEMYHASAKQCLDQSNTIDDLREHNRNLHKQIQNQATSIDGLIEDDMSTKDRNHEYLDTIEGLEKIIDRRNSHIDAGSHVIASRNANIAHLEVEKERLNTVIEEKNTMIYGYRKENDEAWGKLEGLEAELSARKEDSEVLMKVVEIINDESVSNSKAAYLVAVAMKDYLDAPEGLEDKAEEFKCAFCGCNILDKIEVDGDVFCSKKCADGQAEVDRHLRYTKQKDDVVPDEPEAKVICVYLELP